ncbi:alpha/beta hydrolase [Streptomyces sp. 150FB]|uniref:alpha/beta fold hydrolase n=1 Tax=Streptomyces sp. 150FB TaxID=1576605 RepID=UPI0005894B8E|nr:alpha/beta hydrolase [Streptomyces sp. 150FB]KIF77566.1 alpha/beta hydrolase [Streptomyces sp. 150FB]
MSATKDAATRTVNVGGTSFAYREAGPAGGVPLVLLHHVTAVLDDWDPAVVDGLAAERHVILVDLRGVGASGGTTPDTFEAMAEDAVAFIGALGLPTVDLLGYSLGGIVAQVIAQTNPDLVRRIVLAATTPAGAQGPASTGAVLQAAIQRATSEGKHPKHYLFFEPTPAGQKAADSFLGRLDERTEDRDTPMTDETIAAQLTALASWEQDTSPTGLKTVNHPVLVVNGDNDTMWPTTGTLQLAQMLPNARLAIYPDSGHGGIFQYHELFVRQTLEFLRG